MKRRIVFLVTFSLLVILAVYLFLQFNSSFFLNEKDDNLEKVFEDLSEGYLGFDIYDREGNFIEKEDQIPVVDGMAQGTIRIGQNFSEKRNYMLLFLKDYVHTDFYMDDQLVPYYCFELDKQDGIAVDFDIDMQGDDCGFISYVIITEPQYEFELGKIEISKMVGMSLIVCITRIVSDTANLVKSYISYTGVVDSPVSTGFMLTKDMEEFIILPSAISEDSAYLIVDNDSDEEVEYALFALLDWKQYKLFGENVSYIRVPANTKIYLETNLPVVDDVSQFQIYSISKPDEGNEYISHVSETIRCTIYPGQE